MPAKYFTIEGLATYVHHTGPTTLPGVVPDTGRGERILCLHGSGGNGRVFRELFSRLEARHSLLAFDQPAHGRSGGLDSLGSVERLAGFTQALIHKLSVRPPVLLGHSLGGAIAMQCALESPGELRALILCSSAARFERPVEERGAIEQLRRVVEGKERRRFTRDAYAQATPIEIVQRGWMEDARTDPRAVLGDMLACQRWNAEDRIASIALPTLVIVGGEEEPRLRAHSERLAEGIPGARLVVVPGARHRVPTEQPEALAEAIGGFLEGLAP